MQNRIWINLILILALIASLSSGQGDEKDLKPEDQNESSIQVLSPDDIEDEAIGNIQAPAAKPKFTREQKASVKRTLSGWRADPRIEEYRLKTKEMFYHGLSSYMEYAYPKDELMPISGSGFDTIGNFSLTLIDALDTVMIMGDKKLFKTLLPLIKDIDFNINVNVSVFETNIRVVGGLLACHIMASFDPEIREEYDWSLLDKAEEMGKKLLPAFNTPTGIPYGTVNLLHGVNKGESLDVCTACAGTFSLEFTWLSLLTEDPIYEQTARKAVRELWKRRSSIDLFGNHINVATGDWVYRECTIGGLVDSFYEYLLKSSIAFSDEIEYNELFSKAYRAIKIWMKKGDWHVDVLMDKGTITHPYFYSLGAFWPGVKILAGDVHEGMEELNAISEIFRLSKFLPEALTLQDPVKIVDGRASYPLRPEFVESLWVAYRATKNPTLLEIAFEIVDRLNNLTRTKYGFANVQDVNTMQLEDKMESFFLAETLKYLYLLFSPDNEYNTGNYVFNTEAHPFPVWSYHYTLIHPIEPLAELAYLDQPIPPTPTTFEHPYKGDIEDAVVSGFRFGVCWRDDWLQGSQVNVGRWRGKMYNEMTEVEKAGGKRKKNKMKKRRKATEVHKEQGV
ncbi:UNVERIFIED_CONTAM: ER degradation-enhancing alpha-mannosidase-like protein 2 [Siphonaria sp. JEL0065]|nr:ER degradation-enhancing alpha-mannosidase-like protein 2 [Siphonaria sp. JEL0065]